MKFFTLISFIHLSILLFAQCEIHSCAVDPVLEFDSLFYDESVNSIVIENITIGEFACSSSNYKSGISVYVYQILPNGERAQLCSVIGSFPDNVLGIVNVDFRQSSFCGTTLDLGIPITLSSSDGFEICDGSIYEFELALYITENLAFEPENTTVYASLNTSEYIVNNIGTIEISVDGNFPGNAQPIVSAKIHEFSTLQKVVTLDCNLDIQLYVEGLSRIANCQPFIDLATNIPSEFTNNFYFKIEDSIYYLVENQTGGQLTGADTSSQSCYGGILTNSGAFIFEHEIVPEICEGKEVQLFIETQDHFTNETASDSMKIIYSGTNCETCFVNAKDYNVLSDFEIVNFNDVYHIKNKNAEQFTLWMYNMNGQIMERKTNATIYNLKLTEKGVYILNIKLKENIYTKKIVVN